MSNQSAVSGLNSLVLFENSQRRSGRGTLMHITRSRVVFEVYNPYSIVQLSEVLPQLNIIRGDRVIYKGRAVVSHILTTGLMVIVSATLVDSWSDLLGLRPGGELKKEADRFVEDWIASNRIIPGYQISVSSMRNFLGEINGWLEEAEVSMLDQEPADRADALFEAFYDEVSPSIGPKLTELFAQFEDVAGDIPSDEATLHKSFARRELHPLILCSPFVDRSYFKPLGYAGDYEMVNMMLFESDAQATSVYARIVDSYFVNAITPQAHRNRIGMLVERLERETERVVAEEERMLTVLNVGCGPASEIQRFIRSSDLSNQVSFQLMDFNDETLSYAEGRIRAACEASGNEPILNFVHKSIDELLQEIQQPRSEGQPQYDLVYCAGLFDYFSDQICRRLVALFHSWTNDGGLVTVTNVHARNPNRLIMEHLLEWYLVYRDDQQMRDLVPPGARHELVCDKTGVNVFLDIRKED